MTSFGLVLYALSMYMFSNTTNKKALKCATPITLWGKKREDKVGLGRPSRPEISRKLMLYIFLLLVRLSHAED